MNLLHSTLHHSLITDQVIPDLWLGHTWLLTGSYLMTDMDMPDHWLGHIWSLTQSYLITDCSYLITDWVIPDHWLGHTWSLTGTYLTDSELKTACPRVLSISPHFNPLISENFSQLTINSDSQATRTENRDKGRDSHVAKKVISRQLWFTVQ